MAFQYAAGTLVKTAFNIRAKIYIIHKLVFSLPNGDQVHGLLDQLPSP